jgi:predicted RNA binding protein YcfA (HicA-like mRNA interferase family)
LDSRTLIRILEGDGWQRVSQKGSHVTFKHSTRSLLITVPHPNKDLPSGTVHQILKKAGLK